MNHEAFRQQIETAAKAIAAIESAICELGEVPSGVLYAHLMGKIDLTDYNQIISILKGAGIISETPDHILKWKHPELKCNGGYQSDPNTCAGTE